MRSRMLIAALLVLPGALAASQEPEFAATSPPKVNLSFDEPPPVAESTESGSAVESAAPDPVLDGIAVELDRMDAAAASPASGENGADANAAPTGRSTATMALQGVGALCAVLALLFLLSAAARRWGKRTPLLAGQHLAKVIGRVGLSPQASLHFVQTNGEVLLLGVTPQGVTLLRTFDAGEFGVPAATSDRAPATEVKPDSTFLAQLTEARAVGAETAVDADLDKLKGELQRLKQYFQDSARARE